MPSIDYIDHHTHTCHSPDADQDATFEAYIAAAEQRNIKGLMFTDHVDLDTPVALFQSYPDYPRYVATLETLRQTTNVTLQHGVEIGLQPHLRQALNDFLTTVPFDLVIGSIHVGDGRDFYNGDFFQGYSQSEAYRRYFEIALDAVIHYDNFDVFGHLDYIIRYGGYADKQFDTIAYDDLIMPLLRRLAEKGKAVEINTSGLRYGLGVMHPKCDILRRFKDVGGQYVTLGSDAHTVKDLQAGFPEALKCLAEVGFDAVTSYVKRVPHQQPLAALLSTNNPL